MADRGIQLRRFEIRQVPHYHLHGFRLRVEVAQAVGMDKNVFVCRRHPPDPNTGEVLDEFIAVASFPDLAEYPVGDPSPELALPFFRRDWLEIDLRSTRDLEDAWQAIRSQVCTLVAALNRADQLVLAEEVWCGTAPAESAASESV